jgi:hypothetical protein
MAGLQTKGKCKFCNKELGKGWMTKHLAVCEARKMAEPTAAPGRGRKFLDLLVEGSNLPMYWMHLQMPVSATLADLDKFLRDEWLECCGHLSAFRIGEESYSGSGDVPWIMGDVLGFEDNSMDDAKLGEILKVGDEFTHEYDFGSTTELKLKVTAEIEKAPGKGRSKRVEVLARNEAPEIRCDLCGELATQICTECIYDDTGLLCPKHAREHKCDEEMLLPLLNSPRAGVCGYGT